MNGFRTGHPPPLQESMRIAAQVATIGLFGIAVIAALIYARSYMVPICAAVLVGFTFGPAIDWLHRRGLNEYLASTVVIAGVAAILTLVFIGASGALEEWTRRVPQMWHRALEELRFLREPLQGFSDTLDRAAEASVAATEQVPEVEIADEGIVQRLFSVIPTISGQIVTFLGTLFFFLANRSRVRVALLAFCVAPGARLRTIRILRGIERHLSRYVASISAVNVGLGAATAVVTALLGLPSPLLWGLLACALNYAPYVGPAVMAALLAGVGLVVHETLSASLLPAGAYLVLNFIEAQFVTPSVLGRTLTINPLVIFLALTFWLWLWGPIGAFLAVPILIVCAVLLHHVVRRRPAPLPQLPGGRSASSPMKPAARPARPAAAYVRTARQ